MDTLLTPNRI
jgi:hypothetical protein